MNFPGFFKRFKSTNYEKGTTHSHFGCIASKKLTLFGLQLAFPKGPFGKPNRKEPEANLRPHPVLKHHHISGLLFLDLRACNTQICAVHSFVCVCEILFYVSLYVCLKTELDITFTYTTYLHTIFTSHLFTS